jgi:hypothetical protein
MPDKEALVPGIEADEVSNDQKARKTALAATRENTVRTTERAKIFQKNLPF